MDNASAKSMNTIAVQVNSPPSRRRRIAIVTETFPPEVNGVANTLYQLTQRLKNDYSVQVIHPRQPATEDASDDLHHIRVAGCPIPGYSEMRFGFPCRKKLLKLWQDHRPDAVYVATQGPLGWSAVSACRELNIPVSSGFHTNFHQYSRHYRLGWLSRLIGRYFIHFHQLTRHTLVPTRQTAAALDTMGISNTCVWSRGVDGHLFHPDKRSELRRKQWGADASTPVFIYVGRLANEKNVFLALSAFERAQQQASHARMVLVGGGPLQEKITRMYPDVIFAGVQKGESLAEHYASADIFLFPSLTDTFGNVVLEAMASGLGIVSFNEAAAREHLHHDESALLAPSGNSDLFCQHALSLAMRPSLLTRLRSKAHQQSKSMDWQQLARQFAHLLLDQDIQGAPNENAKRLRAVSTSR
ncbi:glycoside hydrolase [Hahella sp. CCB-MM4]|uniref:glycosyltransferase family 4 protein n=1 Tax=Hahella sp. (strain CCB-MM4) TaxID=1926491 RepID=UPI000B9B4774|nr:glycosyltransferase family 1 protein [Hahella sp. CCB-MM4]OZG70665.1 glycoside hydrolase [Hahella sp. CCB-MM4]